MTPEGRVKKRVRDILSKYGVYYTMPVTGGYGRQGAPDFICCVRGMFVGIECKSGKNQPTSLQKAVALTIEQSGGVALTIWEHNTSVVENIIKLIIERSQKRVVP